MDVTPLIPKGKQILTGYGAGGFKVNNETIQGSIFLLPDRLQPWPATEPFNPEHLTQLFDQLDGIDIILIGTGKNIAFIPPHIRASLKAKNIAIDAMNTGAACRTYNVLLSEERRVAAALIAV